MDARCAGIQAEIKMVRALMSTLPTKIFQFTMACSRTLSPVATITVFIKLSLRARRVTAMPPIPQRIPMGIPIQPKIKPSKYTLPRFCTRVAPTLASIPKYRARC